MKHYPRITRQHPFELKIVTELYSENLDIEKLMNLCEVLDAFEVEREIEDILEVDVKEATINYVVVRFTPKVPLTYGQKLSFIKVLFKMIQEALGDDCIIKIEQIKWIMDAEKPRLKQN